MKEQKSVTKWSATIGCLSLLLAILLEFRLDSYLYTLVSVLSGHRAFVVDVLLGIFTGAVLTAGVSIVSYLHKKSSTLYDFWSDTEMFSEKASLFAGKYFPYGAKLLDVISTIENSTTILEDSYAIRSDYSNIIKAYRDIAFFRETTETKQLIDNVFSLVGKVNYDISCVCSINANSNIDLQKKKTYATIFEADDCNLQILLEKCKALQEKLNIHFEKPKF